MDLEVVNAISRLKYRYLRCLDTKSWDEFADTLIPEATSTYGEFLQFESRDALIGFMRNTLGPHVITEHHCDHPEIDIQGETATGTWYLADTMLIPEHNMVLRGAAFYTDRYVLCDDGDWRISHTGYERTYEVVVSLTDVPSFRLTSNRWAMSADVAGASEVKGYVTRPGVGTEGSAPAKPDQAVVSAKDVAAQGVSASDSPGTATAASTETGSAVGRNEAADGAARGSAAARRARRVRASTWGLAGRQHSV